MSYKLLALDLDGTVLDEQLALAPAVVAAVAAAQARGVYVTIATGRMFGATVPFARRLAINGPLICFQGALIRDMRDGAVWYHQPGWRPRRSSKFSRVISSLSRISTSGCGSPSHGPNSTYT